MTALQRPCATSDLVEASACSREPSTDSQRADRTVQLERRHAFAMRRDAALDLDRLRRAARLDAQGDRGQLHDHTVDQRVAGAAEGLDAAMHHQPANRLADLDADSTIGMRRHALNSASLTVPA